MSSYDHGYGTGAEDEIHTTQNEARNAFVRLLAALFGRGGYKPPERSSDGRVVTYRSWDGSKTVTVRKDEDEPSTKFHGISGSYDVVSKQRQPWLGGKTVKQVTHIAYMKK
jgi:hypothetical protein